MLVQQAHDPDAQRLEINCVWMQESSGFVVTKINPMSHWGSWSIFKLAQKTNKPRVIQCQIIFFSEAEGENSHPSELLPSQRFGFFFEKSHRKSVLLPSRCPTHEELMCHHGDADEGWCHCDLTAVPSAGSLDPIRIHQPRCTVTFRPVPSLWKMLQQLLNRSRATQFIWKGKVREKTSISCS